MDEKRFRLECYEPHPDTGEVSWRKWSTYRDKSNALERRDLLRRKGKDARILDTETGEVAGDAKPMLCTFCATGHPQPFDGSCLL